MKRLLAEASEIAAFLNARLVIIYEYSDGWVVRLENARGTLFKLTKRCEVYNRDLKAALTELIEMVP